MLLRWSSIAPLMLLLGCDTRVQPAASLASVPAPLLGAHHQGWKSQHCDQCHELLRLAGHVAQSPPECAACHGGNGACDPQKSARSHAAKDDCIGCHAPHHGFQQDAACASCHLAAAGAVDCSLGRDGGAVLADAGAAADLGAGPVGGDGGAAPDLAGPVVPTLSQALKTGCYGFPSQEFSQNNTASTGPSLLPGDRAVELDLDDSNGQHQRLSSLLSTAPVLLVMGAFT